MNTLPFELLEQILDAACLTREDIIATRLVSRRFCAVLTPRAFHTIRTNSFSRESFDRLYSIAQCPHLVEYVEEYEYKLVRFLSLRKLKHLLEQQALMRTHRRAPWS